jgi:multidrug efflux pump subunit AcrA (membrane-fusion protein)
VALVQARALVKQRQLEYEGAKKLRSSGLQAESSLASAEAALAAAKASLVNAERNLERTKITLPYRGIIRQKVADLGQYVNPGSRLAITFAIDTAEVRLALTDRDLSFLDLPVYQVHKADKAEFPKVTLRAVQRGQVRQWQAQIIRTEGVVDENSRVTYAVAQVIDPYKINQTLDVVNETPLPMGTYVTAEIEGVSVDNIIKVPRISLRGQNQLLFVDEENKLRIRTVSVLKTDNQYAYIDGGAETGERITTTAIESPINGMRLRTTDGYQPPVTDAVATTMQDQ